jgi:hypothetical protein
MFNTGKSAPIRRKFQTFVTKSARNPSDFSFSYHFFRFLVGFSDVSAEYPVYPASLYGVILP